MYAPNHGYSTTSPGPDLSNNPFINDPSNPHTRFPDISASTSPGPSAIAPQYTSWGQPQSPSYQQLPPQQPPQQQYLQPGYGGVPQQQTGWRPQQQPQQPQPTGFQPSSSFGQQLVGQVNSGYYPQQQPQQPMMTGYPGQQQQQQQPQQQYPSYLQQQQPQQQQQPLAYNDPSLAQFDPYAAIGSGWGTAQSSTQPHAQGQGQGQGASSQPPPGTNHPRDYIRAHKAELEAWDTYAWKQLMNAFEALQVAWDVRRRDVKARMGASGFGGGGGQGLFGGYTHPEAERLQQVCVPVEMARC